MNLFSKYHLLTVLFFFMVGLAGMSRGNANEIVPIGPNPDFKLPSQVFYKRHFWVGVGTLTGLDPASNFSGTASAGYLFSYVGVDVRVTASRYLRYGGISVGTSPSFASNGSSYPSGVDPGSELNRLRSGTDLWSLFTYEPGVSVTGRLLTNSLPFLAERVRTGVSFGGFTDQKNGIQFSSLLYTVEAGLQYHLFAPSRFSAELMGTWHVGMLNSNANPGPAGNLPVSYFTLSFALLYWI